MFDNVLKFILLASVTVPNFLNPDALRLFESKFFYIFSLILFCVSLVSQPQRNTPRNILILGASLLSVGVMNIFTHNESTAVLNYVTALALFVLDVSMIITYSRNPESCFKFLAAAVLINSAVAIIEVFYFNPFYVMQHPAPGGMLGNFPRLTIYFAVVLPFVFVASKASAFIALAVSTFSYVKPQLTPFIAVGLITLFMFKRPQIRVLLCLLLASVLIYYIAPLSNSIFYRLSKWEDIISAFFSSTYFVSCGTGLGVFKSIPGEDPQIWSSHLQFIFSAGLSGVLVYFMFLKYFIGNFSNNIQNIAVLNLLIIGVVEYPAEIIRFWPTMAFIFGAYFIKTIQERFVPWKY